MENNISEQRLMEIAKEIALTKYNKPDLFIALFDMRELETFVDRITDELKKGVKCKDAEIFVVKDEFNSPLDIPGTPVVNGKKGDYILVDGESVYVKDSDEKFYKATYSPSFVRLNTKLFSKVS